MKPMCLSPTGTAMSAVCVYAPCNVGFATRSIGLFRSWPCTGAPRRSEHSEPTPTNARIQRFMRAPFSSCMGVGRKNHADVRGIMVKQTQLACVAGSRLGNLVKLSLLQESPGLRAGESPTGSAADAGGLHIERPIH